MEQPPSPLKVPPSPFTPLQQLSPDRINQQRIPASPSLPSQLSNADTKIPRQSIDVQSKVAFLNSLNQAGSPSRQQGVSSHASLQRALLGREEAENALRNSNTQLAEAEVRQRKISERLESLMEELQSVKERQAHERQVFEKEVRKARKDAFRAGSALVKIQEDLKESRVEVKNIRAEAQHERFEKEKAKQEAFERAYTLAGLLEETEAMREKMRATEAAREAELLEKQSSKLQKEEDDRYHAERRQEEEEEHAARLPKTFKQQEMQEAEQTDQFRQNRFERIPTSVLRSYGPDVAQAKESPMEQLKQPIGGLQQDTITDADERLLVVDAELEWERKLRIRAEEMVHFLQMECQFNICACRVAEKNGERFVHDKHYQELAPVAYLEQTGEDGQTEAAEPQEHKPCEPSAPAKQTLQLEKDMFSVSRRRDHEDQLRKLDESVSSATKALPPLLCEDHLPSHNTSSLDCTQIESSQAGLFNLSSIKNASSPDIFSAEDMTYQSPIRAMIRPRSACSIPLRDVPTSPPARSPSASPYPLTPGFKTPQRQGLRLVHGQTTTMMVPLRDNDDVFCPAPGTPGTPVSREAALAQIRARRDRARSVAISTSRGAPGSARRGLAGGLRDVSAPGRF
jgi:hypothetical protein